VRWGAADALSVSVCTQPIQAAPSVQVSEKRSSFSLNWLWISAAP
jgi:hypothetical protein